MPAYQYVHVRKISWSLALGIAVMPYVLAWALLGRGYSNVARAIAFGWMAFMVIPMVYGFLSADQSSVQSSRAASAQALVAPRAAQSQAEREKLAEDAFKQIDVAETNYPPLGADPANYNAAITRAYHTWERVAEAAYGTDWKSIWRTKHAGSVAGCEVAHNNGMPYDACYEAAASEGDIEPLEAKLMKCPSWDDPSGAIFNPHDASACAARERMKAASLRVRGVEGVETNDAEVPDDQAAIATPSQQSQMQGQRVEVPVILGGNANLDACSNGVVVGLNPNGDGFLSVRSGPGGRQYHEIDRLFNGNQVYTCNATGPWLAIVYDLTHGTSSRCGITQAWPRREAYTGPCRYGWVHSHYVKIWAG